MKMESKESWWKYASQILAAFIVTTNSISDGMHFGWSSPVLPKLQSDESPISISATDKKWLELLYLLGGIAGLPLTMYTVDKFGRKKSILIALINNLSAWILIAVATRVEFLYVARFLAGIGADVAFVSVPMYIAEISHKNIRGFLASFIYINLLIGVLICYSVFPFVSVLTSSCVGASFILFQLLVFPFMHETPYLHLLKNREKEAEASLRWFRRSDKVEEELEEIKAAVARQSQERGSFKDLFFVKSNRKAVIIMTVLNGAQHFSSISVTLMNLHSILDDADGIIETKTAAILFSVIMLICSVISASIVDRFGRKVLLIASTLLSAVALGALAIYMTFKHHSCDVSRYNWVPVAAVLLYAGAFRLGLGLVSIILTSELFPTSVKAKGMTMSDAMFVVFGSISVYMYQVLESSVGIHVPFYIFSGCCILTTVFVAVYIPETKGKTLEQIQMILKGEKNNDPIK